MRARVLVIMVCLLTGCLPACTGTITVKLINPEGISNDIQIETARRTMVAIDGGQVTVVTGQVAIDDATVQALGRAVIPIVRPQGQ